MACTKSPSFISKDLAKDTISVFAHHPFIEFAPLLLTSCSRKQYALPFLPSCRGKGFYLYQMHAAKHRTAQALPPSSPLGSLEFSPLPLVLAPLFRFANILDFVFLKASLRSVSNFSSLLASESSALF